MEIDRACAKKTVQERGSTPPELQWWKLKRAASVSYSGVVCIYSLSSRLGGAETRAPQLISTATNWDLWLLSLGLWG